MPEHAARAAFLRGARDLLPPAPGIFAWGLVTGVAMVKSGLSTTAALVLSLAAYAGSAQLAAMPLLAAFTPVWIVLFTATAYVGLNLLADLAYFLINPRMRG